MEVLCLPRLMVWAALCVMAGGLVACNKLPFVLTLAPGLLAIAILRVKDTPSCARHTGAVFCLIAILPVIAYCYYLARLPRPATNDLSISAGRRISFTARVLAVLPSAAGSCRCIVAPLAVSQPESRRADGHALVELSEPATERAFSHSEGSCKIPASLESGSLIQVTARIEKPSTANADWQFDGSRYFARKSIFAVARADSLAAVPEAQRPFDLGLTLDVFCQKVRQKLVSAHESYIGKVRGDLLASMVLGDRAVQLSDETSSRFRDVGLSHLLAASGFNLTLVIAVTYAAVRLLIPSVRVVNAACFATMMCFVGLAGASPSILRAAVMCTLVLVGRSSFRTVDIPAALAAAFLLTMLVDPSSIADIGFQLSYAATAGIIYGASALGQFIYSGRAKLQSWLAETFSVVAVAQCFVLPIQLSYFWQAGALFLPANLLVSPCITPVTILGFASSLVSLGAQVSVIAPLCGGVAWLIDQIASLPLIYMLAVANWLSSFEQARLKLGAPSALGLLIYYGALLFCVFALRTRSHRSTALACFAIGIFALVYRSPIPVTIACFSDAVVIVDQNRHGILLPLESTNLPQAVVPVNRDRERFCAFNAVAFDDRFFERRQMNAATQVLVREANLQIRLCAKSESQTKPSADAPDLLLILPSCRGNALSFPAGIKTLIISRRHLHDAGPVKFWLSTGDGTSCLVNVIPGSGTSLRSPR